MAKKAEEVKIEEIKAEVVDDGRVEIPPLFYDKERYSAPVAVLVNGQKTLIPRGVSGLRVKKNVARVLMESEYQAQMANRYIKDQEGIKNLGEV